MTNKERQIIEAVRSFQWATIDLFNTQYETKGVYEQAVIKKEQAALRVEHIIGECILPASEGGDD